MFIDNKAPMLHSIEASNPYLQKMLMNNYLSVDCHLENLIRFQTTSKHHSSLLLPRAGAE